MTVEEAHAPDNYFSDLTGDEAYYRDILVAVQFDVVDIPAGEAFNPEAEASREFAAQTLNCCLGFWHDSEEGYTFSESGSVTYPDDIQVAINPGWFSLSSNRFLPDQGITEDGAEVVYVDEVTGIEYEDAREADRAIAAHAATRGSRKLKTLQLKKSIPLDNGRMATVTAKVKNPVLNYKFSLRSKYASVILNADYEMTISASVDLTDTVLVKKLCLGFLDCPGSVFTDMPTKGNWAHDAIDWAVQSSVTAGTSSTTFSPEKGCTRAQVVTFLYRSVMG